jgi:hypothetical protein
MARFELVDDHSLASLKTKIQLFDSRTQHHAIESTLLLNLVNPFFFFVTMLFGTSTSGIEDEPATNGMPLNDFTMRFTQSMLS